MKDISISLPEKTPPLRITKCHTFSNQLASHSMVYIVNYTHCHTLALGLPGLLLVYTHAKVDKSTATPLGINPMKPMKLTHISHVP